MSTPAEAIYEEWMEWFGRIDRDITRLASNREVWRETRAIVVENDAIPHANYFIGWLTTLYVGAQIMGIRRQADARTDVASMFRLLTSISANPHVLSRDSMHERFLRRMQPNYEGDEENMFELLAETMADFERDFLTDDGSGIRRELVNEDLGRLTAVSERIKTYSHKEFAHLSDQPFEEIPTRGEVDMALDELGRLLLRYTYILEGVGRLHVEPVIQDPWQAAFTVPWRTPPNLPPTT